MSSAESVFRVERGRASREELAALCAVLCAVLAARADDGGDGGDGGGDGGRVRGQAWHRGRAGAVYRPPRAWR
ncbi:acyl-CoA carboxylase subunit epsilon [Streptomyces sp. NBC_01478]|uniref:acyl-CoA carboxylase epsilon subunit n=1 Tax=Streptomyces sp. NBC_01478 TaxID=2903882 RepID=UPI002E326DEE|nr:acyl-CoA carboxylase epsilon subunit [Streptomyces sp. NBC_01478]